MHFVEEKEGEKQGELVAPVATRTADPGYPLELMRQNVRGTVILSAVINADGSVGEVRVLNSIDDRLDEYASNALARWRFLPALKNGNPVALQAVVMIPFRPRPEKAGFEGLISLPDCRPGPAPSAECVSGPIRGHCSRTIPAGCERRRRCRRRRWRWPRGRATAGCWRRWKRAGFARRCRGGVHGANDLEHAGVASEFAGGAIADGNDFIAQSGRASR